MDAKSGTTILDDISQLAEAFPDRNTRYIAGILTVVAKLPVEDLKEVLTPDIVERLETMRSREDA